MTGELASRRAPSRLRNGAVTYLNSRPLTDSLSRVLPDARITFDLPSRLADQLARDQLDVALIPSVEFLRTPSACVVSDACVACDGPVRSVKLYSHVPVQEITSLALDEGSRTSAALARLLLKARHNLEPELVQFPIGASLGSCTADAVLVIGDRAMFPVDAPYHTTWDLGEEWSRWTGLPFVFAMWVARSPGIPDELEDALAAARDEGTSRLQQIASDAANRLHLDRQQCLVYLRDHLEFRLGPRQRQGLDTFRRLAAEHNVLDRMRRGATVTSPDAS